MKIVFLGTPAFAVPSLEALIEAGHELALVITQPDRRRGRSKKLLPSEVKAAAEKHGVPVAQPERIAADKELRGRLEGMGLELGVVVAYGQYIPRRFREAPRHNMINVHASLLPRYRGASPISEAILNGDAEAGVSIMEVARRMDAGRVLARAPRPLTGEETTGSLTTELAELGAATLIEAVAAIEAGRAVYEPQDESKATMARKLAKADGALDWSRPAAELERRIRALNPWPMARFLYQGQPVIIEEAAAVAGAGEPGLLLSLDGGAITVATGSGALALRRLKPAGKKSMAAADFANGRRLASGQGFENG